MPDATSIAQASSIVSTRMCTMAASWAVAFVVCRRLCAPGAEQSDHQPGRSTMALAPILLDRIDDDPLAVPLALPDLAIDRVGIRLVGLEVLREPNPCSPGAPVRDCDPGIAITNGLQRVGEIDAD